MERGAWKSWQWVGCLLVLSLSVGWAQAQSEAEPDITLFLLAASPDEAVAQPALEQLARNWQPGHTGVVLDLIRLMRPAGPRQRRSGEDSFASTGSARSGGAPTRDGTGAMGVPGVGDNPPLGTESRLGSRSEGSPIRARYVKFLEKQNKKRFGDDLDKWRRWLWRQPYAPHSQYAYFKGGVLRQIDPRFMEFFADDPSSTVRLDQIDWGGVAVDGIPKLVNPQHVPAAEASHMKSDQVVFGIVVNGEARAYPKRILAWHEMATDRLGGVDLTVVYCTLCGTVIPYDSQVEGESLTFGTSGLLYRSNKLMYDAESNSLWNTLYGRPVVGPMVDRGVELTSYPVVTTSWGDWLSSHPATTVLTEQTGHQRDYSEGSAYRDYFGTDELMFEVAELDKRLKNKAEVLVLPGQARRGNPVAVSSAFLKKKRIAMLEHGEGRWVIVTSPGGAHRVYRAGSHSFVSLDEDGRVADDQGRRWELSESELSLNSDGEKLQREAAHQVFWFAWHAQHPETRLVK